MKLKESRRLVRVMTDQKVSVRGLATKVGCSSSFIQQLRSGKRDSCTPALAALIARHLDVTTEYLFDVRTSSPAGDVVHAGRVA